MTPSRAAKTEVAIQSQLDELLDPPALAEYLGVPLATVYSWRSRGRGPKAVRVGRFLRYRASDVTGWLARGGDTAPTANTPA